MWRYEFTFQASLRVSKIGTSCLEQLALCHHRRMSPLLYFLRRHYLHQPSSTFIPTNSLRLRDCKYKIYLNNEKNAYNLSDNATYSFIIISFQSLENMRWNTCKLPARYLYWFEISVPEMKANIRAPLEILTEKPFAQYLYSLKVNYY